MTTARTCKVCRKPVARGLLYCGRECRKRSGLSGNYAMAGPKPKKPAKEPSNEHGWKPETGSPLTTARTYTDDEAEFLRAIEARQKAKKTKFLPWSDVLGVLKSLGYAKPSLRHPATKFRAVTPRRVTIRRHAPDFGSRTAPENRLYR